MKRLKKLAATLLAVTLFLLVLPITASANGPVSPPWYIISLENLPEETAYVDLLIPLTAENAVYTELNEKNLPDGFLENAEIVAYHENGFCSYTFHYKSAMSSIVPDDDNTVAFCSDLSYNYDEVERPYEHFQDIDDRGQIQLAMLDASGNILQVSSVYALRGVLPFVDLHSSISYDAASDQWDGETDISITGIILYIFVSMVGVALTCGTERLAAWPLGLGKRYGRMILKTNCVSQIIMRILFLALYSVFWQRYALLMALLEIPVYIGEFMFYRAKMKDISMRKIAAYTVAANTLSLVLGYKLNEFLFYWM